MHIKNFDPYDFSKKEIDGVTIYYKNIPWAPCINIRVVFNTGAFNDPVGKEGLSHFLEHMILAGSPMFENKKALKEWSKKNALNSFNAWTSFYNTTFWLRCLPEKFDVALSGMKDAVFGAFIRPEDVEKERKVITQEAWGRFQNEKFLKYIKEINAILHPDNKLSRFFSALGWPETIEKISREDLASWHKENYGLNNFFIVVTGNFEESDLDKFNSFLKDLPKVSPTELRVDEIKEPTKNEIIKEADEIGEIKEQVEVSYMRFMDKLPDDSIQASSLFRFFINDLLNDKLRYDHSLCYGVSVRLFTDNTYSQFLVNVKTDQKNIDLVDSEFKKLIEEIQASKFEERFGVVKSTALEQIRSEELMSDDVADTTVRQVSSFKRNITLKEILENMQNVTYADMIRLSKLTTDPKFLFREIILPSKK